MANKFYEVMHIMTSEDQNLRSLAEMTSFPVFSFYRGADLRGVDLVGQNLRGMNFEAADLRGAMLEEVEFDIGAFNGAKLDDAYRNLSDEFDIYLSDFPIKDINYISLNYRFREKILETLLKRVGVTYKDFALIARTSTATVRRVRDSQPVANETIFGVVEAMSGLVDALERESPNDRIVEFLSQPVINVGYYDNNGSWNVVTREEIPDLCRKLEFVNNARYGENWRARSPYHLWNNKPPTLDWSYNNFERYGRAYFFDSINIEGEFDYR